MLEYGKEHDSGHFCNETTGVQQRTRLSCKVAMGACDLLIVTF